MKKLFKKVVGYAAFALAALVPALSANAVTFYLDTEAAGFTWSKAEFYYWWGSGDNKTLPGEKVQGTNYVWKFTSDFEESNYLFKNGNWDGSNQTVNGAARILDGHLYKLTDKVTSGSDNNKWNFKDEGTYAVGPSELYILGNVNGNSAWNNNTHFKMNRSVVNGYYSYTLDITGGGYFGFTTKSASNENACEYGYASGGQTVIAGNTYDITSSDGKGMNLAAGNYTITVTFTSATAAKMTIAGGQIAVPDKLDLNYKYDNKWTKVGMTKDGSKFKCTLQGVQRSKDYFFHFNSESNCYQSTSDQNDAHYTNGDGRKLDFKIQDGNGKFDFKYWYGDSECDLTIEIDFSTMKVTVLRSNYTEPVQPDNQYYFLGDVNNWMNDGTYTTNGKEYGYGYSKAENGVRADYKFEPTSISGDDSWYVLDMSKTKTGGKLWGQFIIVQDKGVFQPAKLEENRNDGRDVINWKGNWEQWSNDYDRTDKNNYLKETVKAYIDVPSDLAASAGVAEKVIRSNFHLNHNLYKGVKIYFNPTTSKIFMTYSDYQDFYIYLSTTADRAENGDRKVNVIKESMNNDNYTLDFSSVRVVNSDGSILESDTDNKMEHVEISGEGDELPNGLKFTNYWKIKIPNGLEGPSGQKFMVSIDGAQDEGAKAFTSIFLNNLYFIDGVRVFATHSADVEVAAVSYRIYGLPADGDPENLQIFAADGTQKAVKDDPNDEFGWVDLQWGDFGYHPTSTSWWAGTVPVEFTDIVSQKTGFYPSFKDAAKTVYHEVPASHASECIQWKITYGQRPSAANGMKKTRTGVQLNPATADLTVDRSDLNADWVLNGRHKELVIGVATGVEDIEIEDAEINEEGEVVAPVYYNLQGVRVAEPQHGLYIKVTGNKSEKILVK